MGSGEQSTGGGEEVSLAGRNFKMFQAFTAFLFPKIPRKSVN